MMSPNNPGRRRTAGPPKVIQRLAADLAQLMEQELTRDGPAADRLLIGLLLLLGGPGSRYYQTHLLYRGGGEDSDDAGERYFPGYGTLRINPEAEEYLHRVFWERTVEPNRAEPDPANPTAMHRLLEEFLQRSAAPGAWDGAAFRRHQDRAARLEPWFARTHAALELQRGREATRGIGTVAANRRREHGPWWLEAGPCAAAAGEEWTFGDLAEAVPTPLRPGFAAEPGFRSLVERPLDTVNRPYALLRGCGLRPAAWLDRLGPGDGAEPDAESLSLGRLQELRRLRKTAADTAAWVDGRREDAFREAFSILLEETLDRGPAGRACRAGIGGFGRFEDWVASEIGAAMLHGGGWEVGLADLAAAEDTDAAPADFDLEDRSANPWGGEDLKRALEHLGALGGRAWTDDPVLAAFCRFLLEEDGVVWGDTGLLAREEFRCLQAATPQYAQLADDLLLDRLQERAEGLVADVLLATLDTPPAPVLEAYFRRVLIQGQPARGRKGLFNRPDFKEALAVQFTYPRDDNAELERRLHNDALDLLHRLFDAAAERPLSPPRG